jgi:hypothetical protein
MTTPELKTKIRKLKQAEMQIRFGGKAKPNAKLVWDGFFDLKKVAAMSRPEYDRLIEDFFARVYYELYKENGMMYMMGYNNFDPSLLAGLGLPPDADEKDIKARFRALAKEHHPDNAGDAAKFVEIMKVYRELVGG